jgi:hypothetical protein
MSKMPGRLAKRGRGLILDYLENRNDEAMNRKIITIESRRGATSYVLRRIMRMVPDRDKDDKRLQRLLVFRLQHDGEAATCEYLMRYIRRYVRQPEPYRFYDFLIQGQDPDRVPNRRKDLDPDPPGAA